MQKQQKNKATDYRFRNGLGLGIVLGGCVTALGLIAHSFYLSKPQENIDPRVNAESQGAAKNDNREYEFGGVFDGSEAIFLTGDTIATWIIAVMTTLSALFLLLTLRHVAETAKASVEASKSASDGNALVVESQRPWVSFSPQLNEYVHFIPDRNVLEFRFHPGLRNQGKSPATDVAMRFNVWLTKDGDALPDRDPMSREAYFEALEGCKSRKLVETIFPDEGSADILLMPVASVRLDDVDIGPHDGFTAWVSGAVAYRVPGGFGSAVISGVLVTHAGRRTITRDEITRSKIALQLRIIDYPTYR